MLITAASFLQAYSVLGENQTASNPIHSADDQYKKRPNPNDFPQSIMKAIAIGINAPSPHNTQSWKFKLVTDDSMLFYIDRDILLPQTDPPSRQIHIGAGCFIETLVIGITQLGLQAEVKYFPEGYQNEADYGIKPVALISVKKLAGEEDPLSQFILKRQTNRRPTIGEMISDTSFEDLQRMSGKSHSKVSLYNQNLDPFKKIFYSALDLESRTRRTNEETRLLFRFSETERAMKGNGLSMPQMGYQGMLLKIVEKAVKNGDPELWHNPKTIDKSMKTIKKSIDSTKSVVVWVTETNTITDWIENGRDYVRLSLAAASHNLYLHPYNQAIQEFAEMDKLRKELDQLIGVSGNQKIQFIARIGQSTDTYYSYRKSLDAFVIK
jgi:hypothetical protein